MKVDCDNIIFMPRAVSLFVRAAVTEFGSFFAVTSQIHNQQLASSYWNLGITTVLVCGFQGNIFEIEKKGWIVLGKRGFKGSLPRTEAHSEFGW